MSIVSAASDNIESGSASGKPARAHWTPGLTPPRSWRPDVLLALTFLLITALLLWPSPLTTLDIAVRDWFEDIRQPWTLWPVRVFTYFGQGTPLTIGCLILCLWAGRKYRTARPAVMFACAWLLLVPVQIFKRAVDRIGPHFPERGQPPYPDAEASVLFSGLDPAQSFPSGHAVNAVVFFWVVVIILGAALPAVWRRLMIWAPPACVFVSQTYLGWHWLSDFPAGLILGVLIVRLIARVPWATMRAPEAFRPGARQPEADAVTGGRDADRVPDAAD